MSEILKLALRQSCARLMLVLCLAFAASAGGCTRFDALNATVPSCSYTRRTDLAYGEFPRQKLDVYRPRGVKGAAGAPVVIFFYGGDWQTGRKGDYRFVAEAMASRGFVAVLPDYRLFPRVTFPAFVEDGALAVRWTRENVSRFGGDPDRVFLMGHSAGAHIAALLTLDAHYLADVGLDRGAVRATAALSGPYDFVPGKYHRAVFGMSADDTSPDPRINPIHFADGQAPPMLLVHGAKDNVVSPSNATNLAARIRAGGGSVRRIIYAKRGHPSVVLAFACSFRWLAPVLDDTTAFFRKQ